MRRCDAGGKMAGLAVAATGLGLLALAGGAADGGSLGLARALEAVTAIVTVIVTATAATVIPSRK